MAGSEIGQDRRGGREIVPGGCLAARPRPTSLFLGPFLAVALGLALPFAAEARPASCTLAVDGRTYIDGPCDFDAEKDGSFQIRAKDYFAYVTVTGSGRATGSWNADPRSTHAHASLGELMRKGSCWENARARICARDLLPERRAAIEAVRPNGAMLTPAVAGASRSCVAPLDGRWVAGARLVLRNCRPETDKGFTQTPDGGVMVMNGSLCVAVIDNAPLELAPCGATPTWTWTGASAEGRPIRDAQNRCWTIPALDDAKAVFPFPLIAARCQAGAVQPVSFFFSKG